MLCFLLHPKHLHTGLFDLINMTSFVRLAYLTTDVTYIEICANSTAEIPDARLQCSFAVLSISVLD